MKGIGFFSWLQWLWIPALILFISGCTGNGQTSAVRFRVEKGKSVVFGNDSLELEFDGRMVCRIRYGREKMSLNLTGNSVLPAHYLVLPNRILTDFALDFDHVQAGDSLTESGPATRLLLTGLNKETGLVKQLSVLLYNRYPGTFSWTAAYRNTSSQSLLIRKSVSDQFLLDPSLAGAGQDMWTYQGIAYDWGMDYMFPLKPGFYRKNYTGVQPASRMGGGVPVMDFWTRKMGLAIAHLEKKPRLLSFPVDVNSKGQARIAIEDSVEKELAPGETYTGIRSAVILHHLDFFNPLSVYASLMKDQGLHMSKPSPETYEPFWCGWGYESDFTLRQIYGTLPKIKALGFKWVVIDDRWFDRYGDWNPRKEIFPGGEKQIKALVDSIHKMGLLAKIWWTPILAQPDAPPPGGKWPSHSPGMSDVVRQHPDWLVMDQNGNYPRCPRNMYFLNASLPAVQEHVRRLTQKFIGEWGFDGHKLDAFWVEPPSYDPATPRHEASYEDVPGLIRIIQQTSKAIKPYSVTEICNCGTPQDFFQSLYIDQPVVADPTSFTQVRFRVKAFKALWGPQSPVFTDHVEHVATFTDPVVHYVEDNDRSSDDFASTIGTGGVPGSKFTWPAGNPKLLLTPEKEVEWKKWLDIYKEKGLSRGNYLNLYDLAFDYPEAHAIEKGDTLYYAFYNPDWKGEVELRGLKKEPYVIKDYEQGTVLGTWTGPVIRISHPFVKHLLLECVPVKKENN
jgi:alpha-galactosidase